MKTLEDQESNVLVQSMMEAHHAKK